MPNTLQQYAETQPISQATSFTSADTTTAKSILSNPGQPARVDNIIVVTDDTAAVNVDIFLRTVSTNTFLGSINVPAGTGHAGVAPKEFFTAMGLSNFQGLNLLPTQSLQAGLEATMTAAKTTVVTVLGGLF